MMQSDVRVGHAAYQQAQIGSANPVRIVVLLLEGAIRFVHQAQHSFSEPATRGHALGRAHRIVTEMLSSLDHERGGEIAQNLSLLYDYVLDLLIRANVEGQRGGLDSAVQVLQEVLAGFQGIEHEVRGQMASRP
jgi:flagellar secretion chaperone FliS